MDEQIKRSQETISRCLGLIRMEVNSDYTKGSIDSLYKADLISSGIHTEFNLLLQESIEREK